MSKLKFLCNAPNPALPVARERHDALYNERDNSAANERWLKYLDWISQNITGRPKATDKYTVEELEKMGMIGVYAPE